MKKILIVDDERKIVQIIQAYLEREGFQAITAYDGKTAVETAHKQHPDLIVLDLMLPGLDGFGVLEELKLDKRTRHIPIVVVSAKDISAEERRRLSGQIEAIYQKGALPPRAFAEQVIEVLEHKTAHKGEA